jgi:sensor histidine kinase YesM
MKIKKGYDIFKNTLFNEVTANVVGWSIFIGYNLLFFISQVQNYEISYWYCIKVLSNSSLFYLQSFVTFSLFFQKKIVLGVATFFVSILIFYLLTFVYCYDGGTYNTYAAFYYTHSFNIKDFFVLESTEFISFSAYGYVYAVFKLLKGKQKKQIRYQIDSFETETAFLKLQINQHFLYNSLNFIYFKMLKQSDESSNIIVWLSQVVRYSVADKSPFIDINQELEQVELLLKLYDFKTDNKAKIKLVVSPDTKGLIPHLSVLSLVYDAITFSNLDKPISISISPTDNGNSVEIQFFKKQTNFKYQNSSNGRALIERLSIFYPNCQSIHINDTPEQINVTLNLNLYEKKS